MSANETSLHWEKIGELIELFDNRNTNSLDYPFFGINKDKTFMPTVADTNNLDKSKYKVVKKRDFVFSGMQTGRDICIRIALYDKSEPIIISPAYTTFRIKKTTELLPEYFFILFNRSEMDRYGWFLSDSSIRSNLDWDRFCDIEIPLPDIEVQQELVDIYTGLKALSEQNEALIKPLSEACEAFVANAAKTYESVKLGDLIEEVNNINKEQVYDASFARGVNVDKKIQKCKRLGEDLSKYKIVQPNDIVYNANIKLTTTTTKFAIAHYNEQQPCIVTNFYIVARCKSEKLLTPYLMIFLMRDEFARYVRGICCSSIRDRFDFASLSEVYFPLPPIEVQQSIVNIYNCLEEAKRIATEARERLKTLCPALILKAINS